MFTKLINTLDGFIKEGIPGYDCVVYYKGECVFRKFNGYSDILNKVRMNGKELFNIYSCSKIITCTAALIAYEKGLFSLEDNLSKYMPEFEEMYVKNGDSVKKAEKSIIIKNLFCMMAGFSYDLKAPMIQKCKEETNGKCQTRELMKYLAKEPLLFEPGESWEYSLCHDVLAALVEVVSGMKFGEFVKENIFIPLGMINSTFLLDDSDIDKVSTQYRFNKETNKAEVCPKTIAFKLGSEHESGGAGCISTVDDYIKFLEGLRSGKLIKPETVDLMATNHLDSENRGNYWAEGYGYGLGVRCAIDENATPDFGWGGAAGSMAFVDVKNEYTIFYAQHVLDQPIPDLRDQIKFTVCDCLGINQ